MKNLNAAQFILITFFALSGKIQAQQADSYVITQSLTIGSAITSVTLAAPATALAIERLQWQTSSQAGRIVIDYPKVSSDTITLRRDAHAENSTSGLVVFSHPITSLILLDFAPGEVVSLHLVYAKPIALNTAARQWRTLADDCGKPPVVPVSTWRIGLTPPKELPVATTVRFVIVHHAEGSNTTTDYVNVVRSIYVYHTQSNGWNDVGYNFLIAQDGTVFEGRDGQRIMDGDNVQGAHFCSTNGGTMGICLLGSYVTAQPTDAALGALAKLTAWKLNKENITQPLGSAFHASSGKTLATISAHRDGTCPTDCPGDNLYVKMNQLRSAVASQTCVTAGTGPNPPTVVVPTVLAIDPDPEPFALFPNPAQNGQFMVQHSRPISSISLTDAAGRVVSAQITRQNPGRWQVLVVSWPTPDLLVTVQDDTGQRLTRRVVRQ
jgi:N-acetylmuramoyl-L-alanine amidase